MNDQITVTRTFAAPRELVWDVLTTREHFAVWFGTEAVDVPLETLEWDLAVGNRWTAVMHLPDGTTKSWLGEFVEIDRPSRFVFRLTDEPENPGDLAPVTVELADVDGGTELTLTQATPGWSDENRQALIGGYNAFLDSMQGILDRVG
ncbi:SRPBCC family protein [Micromonospora sp. DT81.3]|uniref:SRPBCC family protein n=1 Tax=Micromonospora sp. DT81.3 TaxID=3416523 RepID=UPI003CF1095B